ncbi:hypothetical protein DERF_012595 [Dermatophagoides farinae]|uniref:Uncharacterized protein n=1 Tax=Dermatophagoides farinae TaxID=6954 RepID=A0A922HPV9_DERFA|nr:hypothetical protein DERF_012595 [Dermatophagoides farinae]
MTMSNNRWQPTCENNPLPTFLESFDHNQVITCPIGSIKPKVHWIDHCDLDTENSVFDVIFVEPKTDDYCYALVVHSNDLKHCGQCRQDDDYDSNYEHLENASRNDESDPERISSKFPCELDSSLLCSLVNAGSSRLKTSSPGFVDRWVMSPPVAVTAPAPAPELVPPSTNER